MRPLARFAPILAFAFTLSCADMPIAPRSLVTVTGQITDRDGPGIEQVYVYFESLDPRDAPPDLLPVPVGISSGRPPARVPSTSLTDVSTVTDGQGRYRLTLPAGPYRVMLQPFSGYPFMEIPRVSVSQGTQVNYRYDGVRITGTLTGPGGSALSNAGVHVYRYEPEDDLPVWANGEAIGGRYSLLVPPGTYELTAGASGAIGLPRVRLNVAVTQDTTIDLVLDGHRVTGTVTGQNGGPLERIRIRARGLGYFSEVTTYSRADGTYEMYIPTGGYSFELDPWDLRYIASRDYPAVSITGPTTLDFDMSGVEWTGTVRRTSDSSPVYATVRAYEIQGSSYYLASAVTDTQGNFRLIVRPATVYTLVAGWQGGSQTFGAFTSAADTTFTFYVDAPPLP